MIHIYITNRMYSEILFLKKKKKKDNMNFKMCIPMYEKTNINF